RLLTPLLEKGGQLAHARRTEAGRQLQPVRRHPRPKRRHQSAKGLGGLELLDQVVAVADVTRQLGAEAKVPGHLLGPAAHGLRRGPGIESGIALNGGEDLGVVAEEVALPGSLGVQAAAPGGLAPGWAAEEIGKRSAHAMPSDPTPQA